MDQYDKKNGQGKHTYAPGYVYEGVFEDGVQKRIVCSKRSAEPLQTTQYQPNTAKRPRT